MEYNTEYTINLVDLDNKSKQLKLKLPKGFTIDIINSNKDELVIIEDKECNNKLPKTFNELGKISGYYINSESQLARINGGEARIDNRNIYPNVELADAALALTQLLQLRNRYNGDWKPDWELNDDKYIITYYGNELVLWHVTIAQYVLTFKSKELRNTFLTNFKDLIEIAKPLL